MRGVFVSKKERERKAEKLEHERSQSERHVAPASARFKPENVYLNPAFELHSLASSTVGISRSVSADGQALPPVATSLIHREKPQEDALIVEEQPQANRKIMPLNEHSIVKKTRLRISQSHELRYFYILYISSMHYVHENRCKKIKKWFSTFSKFPLPTTSCSLVHRVANFTDEKFTKKENNA